ncbi:hypothetical protein DdX_05399 [Ditylenchus destructor]|uniref:Uncharacterized protein n=1 Tax=Ditylenchus destructor TaxID=166010 RepID=A0AAD4NC53_9BILA|nr:hypothetical protein DdX_05399 [Ditylenchus destructor]
MYLTTLLVFVAFLGLTHAQGYGRQTFYGAGGGGDSGFPSYGNNGGYSSGQFHPRNNFPRFQNNPQFGNPNTGFAGQSGAGDGSGSSNPGWNSGSSQFGGGQTSFSGQNTGVNRNFGGSSTEVEAAGTQSGQVSQGGASRSDAPAAAPTDIDTTGARTFNRDSQQSGAAVQPEPEAPAADTPQTGQQSGVLLPGTTTVDPNSDKLIPEPPVLGRK